jgi:phosphoribosylanthranilate isomerase
MIPLRIKICGIKSGDIADCAVENGADAVGFVFFEKSPRAVAPGDAASIIKNLPPFVNKTGIFVDKGLEEILMIINESGIDTIQLHGDTEIYNSAFIGELSQKCRLPVIVARRLLSIDDSTVNSIAAAWKEWKISGFVIDSLVSGEYGGTGRTSAWHRLENREAREFARKRIIISGGINHANAGALLDRILPYGLDVSSGVEREKGVKDRALIKLFMERIKELASAVAEGADGALY